MLEHIAFGDEQLDADLQKIIGPWERYPMLKMASEIHVNRPAKKDIPTDAFSFSETSVIIDERPFRIIGAIPKIEAFAASKKGSLTITAALIVAVLSLGLVDVIKHSLENRWPIETSNGTHIVQKRQGSSAKTILSVAVEPLVLGPGAALNQRATGARVELAKTNLNRKPVKYHKAVLSEAKVARVPELGHTSSTPVAVDYAGNPPLVKEAQFSAPLGSQPPQVESNVSESIPREGSSAAFASNIARDRNRRDSVEALHLLRRQ